MYFYGLDINKSSETLGNSNTGWVKVNEIGEIVCSPDFNIEKLAESIASDLVNGEKVALGFEAPMWYPIPSSSNGQFSMTARFKEEAGITHKFNDDGTYKLSSNNAIIPEAGKRWYQIGSQPMVKSYPLGFLLFEWLISKYNDLYKAKHGIDPMATIKATTEFEGWRDDNIPLYLYEGFVTGAFKPNKADYKNFTSNSSLCNNEVVDAFIVATSLRVYVNQEMQSPISITPLNNPNLSWKNHLRVNVQTKPTTVVNSYLTDPLNDPYLTKPESYSLPKQSPPSRFMSVWAHVIRDVNDESSSESKIELLGEKACDVYGFKLRNNPPKPRPKKKEK